MPSSSPSPTTCQDMPSPRLFSCVAFVCLQSLKASEIAAATSAMDSIGLAEIKALQHQHYHLLRRLLLLQAHSELASS